MTMKGELNMKNKIILSILSMTLATIPLVNTYAMDNNEEDIQILERHKKIYEELKNTSNNCKMPMSLEEVEKEYRNIEKNIEEKLVANAEIYNTNDFLKEAENTESLNKKIKSAVDNFNFMLVGKPYNKNIMHELYIRDMLKISSINHDSKIYLKIYNDIKSKFDLIKQAYDATGNYSKIEGNLKTFKKFFEKLRTKTRREEVLKENITQAYIGIATKIAQKIDDIAKNKNTGNDIKKLEELKELEKLANNQKDELTKKLEDIINQNKDFVNAIDNTEKTILPWINKVLKIIEKNDSNNIQNKQNFNNNNNYNMNNNINNKNNNLMNANYSTQNSNYYNNYQNNSNMNTNYSAQNGNYYNNYQNNNNMNGNYYNNYQNNSNMNGNYYNNYQNNSNMNGNYSAQNGNYSNNIYNNEYLQKIIKDSKNDIKENMEVIDTLICLDSENLDPEITIGFGKNLENIGYKMNNKIQELTPYGNYTNDELNIIIAKLKKSVLLNSIYYTYIGYKMFKDIQNIILQNAKMGFSQDIKETPQYSNYIYQYNVVRRNLTIVLNSYKNQKNEKKLNDKKIDVLMKKKIGTLKEISNRIYNEELTNFPDIYKNEVIKQKKLKEKNGNNNRNA